MNINKKVLSSSLAGLLITLGINLSPIGRNTFDLAKASFVNTVNRTPAITTTTNTKNISPSILSETFNVCNGSNTKSFTSTKTIPVKTTTSTSTTPTIIYTTIASALDAAQKSKKSVVMISICEGTYTEDLEISTTKSVTFKGEGKGVTVKGTGDKYAIFTVQNACMSTDAFCYGKTNFENISMTKGAILSPSTMKTTFKPTTTTRTATVIKEYPKAGIFIESPGYCNTEPCSIDTAYINVKKGTFSGLNFALLVEGKVEVTFDGSSFTNFKGDTKGIETSVIYAHSGGEIGVDSGTAAESCDYSLSPKITLKNVSMYNNQAGLGTLFLTDGARIILDGAKIYNNKGAMLAFMDNCSTISLTNNTQWYSNTPTSNSLNLSGDSEASIENSTVKDNTSSWYGAFLQGGRKVTISGSMFTNNSTVKTGGGIYFSGTSLSSTGSTWSGNTPDDVFHKTENKAYTFGTSNFSCDASGCR